MADVRGLPSKSSEVGTELTTGGTNEASKVTEPIAAPKKLGGVGGVGGHHVTLEGGSTEGIAVITRSRSDSSSRAFDKTIHGPGGEIMEIRVEKMPGEVQLSRSQKRAEIRSFVDAYLAGRIDPKDFGLAGMNFSMVNLPKKESPVSLLEAEKPKEAESESTAERTEEGTKAEKLKAEIEPVAIEEGVDMSAAHAFMVHHEGEDMLFANPNLDDSQKEDLKKLAEHHKCDVVELNNEQWTHFVERSINPISLITEEDEGKKHKDDDLSAKTARAPGSPQRKEVASEDDGTQKKGAGAKELAFRGVIGTLSNEDAKAAKKRREKLIKERAAENDRIKDTERQQDNKRDQIRKKTIDEDVGKK